MSLASTETWISAIITTVIGFTTAYYSFAISRTLVNRTYRGRAMWTAMSAIALVATAYPILFFSPSFLFFFLPTSFFKLVVVYGVITADLIILYAWLDSTIRIAIDQDFFHRDTFRWSYLRHIFWVAIILVDLLVWMGPLFPSNYAFFAARSLGGTSFFVVVGLVLFVSGRRTSDRTIRAYLMWLGLITICAVFLAVFAAVAPIAFPAPWVVLAYFLYRAARSLLPISKLEKRGTNFSGPSLTPAS